MSTKMWVNNGGEQTKICRSFQRFGSSSTATWIPISNWESLRIGAPRRQGIFMRSTKIPVIRFTLGYFPSKKDTYLLSPLTSLNSQTSSMHNE